MKIMIFAVACAVTVLANAETPYAFRQRLVTVHRQDRRDFSQKAEEGEFEFQNGMQIVVPDAAPALVRRAAEDFCDYLLVSMDLNTSVRSASEEARPGLSAAMELTLSTAEKQGYTVETGANGVRIVATDDRMAAQALYHLEDMMNLRRGPFL